MDANADVIHRWNSKPLNEPRDSGEKDRQFYGRIAESVARTPATIASRLSATASRDSSILSFLSN